MLNKEIKEKAKQIAVKYKNDSLQNICDKNNIKIIVGNLSMTGKDNESLCGAIVYNNKTDIKDKTTEDKDYTIFINSVFGTATEYFLCALELGNYFMNLKELQKEGHIYNTIAEYNLEYTDNINYLKAYEFAINLLLPNELFTEEMIGKYSISKLAEIFNLPEKIIAMGIYRLKMNKNNK